MLTNIKPSKGMLIKRVIVFSLFLIPGSLYFLYLGFSLVSPFVLVSNKVSSKTSGSVDLIRLISSKTSSFQMIYSYYVNQRKYTEKAHFLGESTLRPNDNITVKYLIKNPEISFVSEIKQAQILEAIVYFIFCFGLCAIYIIILFNVRKHLIEIS